MRLLYRAYGLSVDSPVSFPELPRLAADTGSAPDVVIRAGRVDRPPVRNEDGRGFWTRGTDACFAISGAGTFLVSRGQEITYESDERFSPEQLRVALLGPALALILYQRGLTVLHASAVAVDGAAVAFLGGHGWGKSTMAGLLAARGHRLVSDDVTAIDLGGPTVIPSFPQLKLWPDALQALGAVADDLPRVHPELPKRALAVPDDFAAEPIPLRRLYVLAKGDQTRIEKLPTAAVFEELVRHSYGARFGEDFAASIDLRDQFLRAAQLGRAASVRRMRRPATLMSDPNLAAVIEKEILLDLAS